jgi:hypothetical protein
VQLRGAVQLLPDASMDELVITHANLRGRERERAQSEKGADGERDETQSVWPKCRNLIWPIQSVPIRCLHRCEPRLLLRNASSCSANLFRSREAENRLQRSDCCVKPTLRK